MKKYWYFFCATSVIISGCGNNNPLYAPRLNPHPKYYMTVKGHVDPELPKYFGLVISAGYETNSSNCMYSVNWLEGVTVPSVRYLKVIIKPDVSNNYQIKIPLDYYLPGRCQWAIHTLKYSIIGRDYSAIDMAVFSKLAKLPKNVLSDAIANIACDKKLRCSWHKEEQYNDFLLDNDNYTYILNVKSK